VSSPMTDGKSKYSATISAVRDTNFVTDRVKKRRAEYLETIPHLCADRSQLVTESWKETEGFPVGTRRAKLFQKMMEGIGISIHDGEFIVGSISKYLRGLNPPIDYSAGSTIAALEGEKCLGKDEVSAVEITDEERRILAECAEYWKDQAPGEVIKKTLLEAFPNDPILDYIEATLFNAPVFEAANSGSLPDYHRVMAEGINGIRKRITDEIDRLDMSVWGSYPKLEFYQAGLICCDAVIHWAGRYAKLAKELAESETNPARKRELEQIAETCEWVPANPPRTFREAVQSLWFIHLSTLLEASGAGGEAPARADQYLFPFYEEDLREGRMTRQDAAELLGCLWVKFNEIELMRHPNEKTHVQSTQLQNTSCFSKPFGK
jgi:pyruvate-formate lyase